MSTSFSPRTVEARPETASVTTFDFQIVERLDYRPGQIIILELTEIEDRRGAQRPFTLSSSPTEADRISITTKMTGSTYKKTLQDIAESAGDVAGRVKLEGPQGDFTLDTKRPALMIAGGIGVTPFRSMIRHACDRAEGHVITLLYSSETVDEIVFREELDSLAEDNDWLTVIYTVTQPGSGSWSGRTGRIDADLIAEHAGRLDRPVYYVCGPPEMVGAMDRILEDELAIPDADRRSEKFSGY